MLPQRGAGHTHSGYVGSGSGPERVSRPDSTARPSSRSVVSLPRAPQSETATGSYAYRVQACNSSGCSGYTTSGAVVVTIPPSTASIVSVPSTSSTGSYTVNWGGVAGATSYTW